MSSKAPTTRSDVETSVARQEQNLATREEDRYMVPPVDIYDTADGLVVLADLPCVEEKGLEIRVEDDILTIRGRTSYELPDEPVVGEFRLLNFFRQFELSDEVDQEAISAVMTNGVLKLTLPKAEKAKARQIPVSFG